MKDWTKGMDTSEVKKMLTRIRWLTRKMEQDIVVKSILTDLDYGDMADTVDKLYKAANIDVLAGENLERKKRDENTDFGS